MQLSLFDERDLSEMLLPGLSRRAADVLPQPRAGPTAGPQPPRVVGGHRKRTHPHRRGHPPRAAAVARQGHDRAAVGKLINHYKMAKHFTIEITEDSFTFTRNTEAIAAEAALDGIYVLRTSLPEQTLATDDVMRYKGLEDVERFFRTLNSELDVRPIRHRLADRVRAHMFLRMLSYHLVWHMKQALAPILFVDNDKPAAAAQTRQPRGRSSTLR